MSEHNVFPLFVRENLKNSPETFVMTDESVAAAAKRATDAAQALHKLNVNHSRVNPAPLGVPSQTTGRASTPVAR